MKLTKAQQAVLQMLSVSSITYTTSGKHIRIPLPDGVKARITLEKLTQKGLTSPKYDSKNGTTTITITDTGRNALKEKALSDLAILDRDFL